MLLLVSFRGLLTKQSATQRDWQPTCEWIYISLKMIVPITTVLPRSSLYLMCLFHLHVYLLVHIVVCAEVSR